MRGFVLNCSLRVGDITINCCHGGSVRENISQSDERSKFRWRKFFIPCLKGQKERCVGMAEGTESVHPSQIHKTKLPKESRDCCEEDGFSAAVKSSRLKRLEKI